MNDTGIKLCLHKKVERVGKVVKLFFLNKTYYFCSHECYYSFVKEKHPQTKKEWDSKFKSISEEKLKVFKKNVKKAKNRLRLLRTLLGDPPFKNVHYAYCWGRPRYD